MTEPHDPSRPGADLRAGSLFSGTGALDAAVEAVLGCRFQWVADHYRPARRVLADRLPEAPNLGDLAAVDWTTVAPVDIVCGGFPCQDLSLLGERAGLVPDRASTQLFDTPSGWQLTVRALRALRPALVILENVDAILTAPAGAVTDGRPGTALGAVLADLADLGLDAEWLCADASSAGAPHRRRRWFLAAADPERFRRRAWRDRHQAGLPPRFRWDDSPGGPVRADGPAEPVWGRYAGAIERWALVGPRGPVPHPVLDRARNPDLWRWLMGLPPGWLDRAGPSKELIRLAGNGVVPQQAARAIPVLLDRLAEPPLSPLPPDRG